MAKEVKIGNQMIGGNHPVAIQSMLSIPSTDIEGSVLQAIELEKAGCEILRAAIPDADAVALIPAIKENISIPLVADIHFDYRLALAAVEAGVDKIRINPGNIGSEERVRAVALADSLSFVIKSKNESLQLKTLQFSIHPYFRLENRDLTALTGLEGLVFHDMREGKETNAVWKGEMKITDTFDHEFYRKSMRQLPATICELNGRRLEIASPQSDMLVVWNPGPGWTTEGTELYGGLESGAWRHFMSVEPSIVPYTLVPGETRIFTARMRAWGGSGK